MTLEPGKGFDPPDAEREDMPPTSTIGVGLPPSAVEIECITLGAVLRAADAVITALGILSPEDFYRSTYQKIFQAIKIVAQDGEPVDVSTVAIQLEKNGDLEICGGRSELIDIAESVFTAANVEAHAKIVLDKARTRRIISGASILIERGRKGKPLLELQSVYAEMSAQFSPDEKRTIIVGKGDFLEKHTALGALSKFSSGFPSLDRYLTEGFIPGTVSVIAGRTSSGKSAFRSNLTVNFCRGAAGVLTIATEPTQRSEQNRVLAIMTGISYDALNDFHVWREEDTERAAIVDRAVKEINDLWNLTTVFNRSASSDQVVGLIQRAKQTGPLDVVFIDRFDLMSDIVAAQDAYAKYARYKLILQQFEILAVAEKVHICLILQIRRAGGTRNARLAEYRRPAIDQIREGGSIEEGTDLILFTHRDSMYDEDAPVDEIEIIVGKQREGPAGPGVVAELGWDGPCLRMFEREENNFEN